ncbi:MAG: hypothetical protein RL387_651 [Bacteroidota bacterium]|jgi:gliding motility-associated-like protein
MNKFGIRLVIFFIFISNYAFSQNANNSNFNFSSNNFSYWSWSLEQYNGATRSNSTWSHYNFNPPPAGLTNTKIQMERTGTTSPTFSATDTAIQIIQYNGSPDKDTYVSAFNLQKVPKINGYQYKYSIKLGNRITSNKARKISYRISVPANVTNYIITYAYALVLQDPGHTWDSQPRFTAAVRDPSRDPSSAEYLLNNQKDTIKCASVAYNVPPGVTLAQKNASGFYYSQLNNTQEYYKDWVEVQANLGSYAGKTIILDFEADDCSQGGHWGYAYFALRDDFDAPVISGNTTICSSTSQVYSIPSTAGVNYTWTIPSGWGTISPTSNINSITVTPTNNSGYITVTPNSAPCGNAVSSSIYVTYGSIPADPTAPSGPSTVCASGSEGSTNLNYTINPVTNATDYDWTIPNSWTIVSGGDGTTNVVVNVPANATGTNSISVIAKNGCGSSANSGVSSLSVSSYAPTIGGNSTIISGSSSQCINSSDIVLTSSGNNGNILKWQKSLNGGSSWTDISLTSGLTSYTISNPSETAMYRFDAQNGTCPEAFSTNTAINITSPPQITLQPSSKGVCTGASTSFTINAISNAVSISYQWFRRVDNSSNWVSITNTLDGSIYSTSGTTSTLSINNSTGLNGYQYYCLVTGATCGNTSSDVATLSVSSATTSISSHPTPRVVCSGSTVTLSALASGANLTYQWYSRGTVNSNSGGSIISGQTSNSYSFSATNSSGSQVTNYYYLVATSTCSPNTATSTTNATSVTIDPSASISVTISNPPATICSGDYVTFTANPTNGGANPSFIWTKNSVTIGANSNTLTTNNLSNGDIIGVSLNSDVNCAVGNPASAIPLPALTVYSLPSVASISGPSSVNIGSNISLSNNTPSGIWSSSSSGIASISNGTVSGLSEGLSQISYTVSNSNCSNSATKNITVNAQSPSGLSYTTPNVYIKGTSITALNPTVSGGAITSYTISPSLPTGLVINSGTGIISGTPTVNSAATNYTVTASNSGGSVTAVVNITVNEPLPSAPSGLSYTTPNVYVKGTAITALNPTVSGGSVTGYTISPNLPSGLVINSSTGIISGTPTINSAATNYTVTASNSGGSVTAVVNITVKLDQPQGSISSIDYTLLNTDTLQFKLNTTEGTSPFIVILSNNQNSNKDTITNLSNGSIFKLNPIAKTTIFNIFKLFDAGGTERNSGFTKDTSIINIVAPNLALTLKAETPVKQPDNSFKTQLLVKLKNAGELGLKNVQVNANLSQVFPNYLNYVLDSIKVKSGNIKLNANYTGKGTAISASSINATKQSSTVKSNASLDANYLLDNGVNLAISEEAEVQYFMSIAATPNSITLKLQFETEGQAVITKNDGTISQQTSKAFSDNGINITTHPNITSIGSPIPTYLPLYPIEKIGVSLTASNASIVTGGYTFDFVAKIKNYSNLNLDTIAILNDLSKTFTSPDSAYIVNTPSVTGGMKYNSLFNGYSNLLLIDSSAKLAVGDSATISYTLKVITDKINYTWLNSLKASGHSTLDYDYIDDISVEGTNPDPNGDNDPIEQTETRFFVSYIRPEAPTVSNATYTYNTNYPKSISGLVKTYPVNSVPVWCDLATSICDPIAPSTPLVIGKYVYYLKTYDSTTRLYSLNYTNDTVIIKPPVPTVKDSTYIIGLSTNPKDIGVQIQSISGATISYQLNGIKLSSVPLLGNKKGINSYTVNQIVNQIESDTVGLKVNMISINDVIHLQKIAGEAQLQSNSTFNIPFKFVISNLLNKKIDGVLITDNLLNSIILPSTFNVVSVNSTSGLIPNKIFNGTTDISLTSNQTSLSPLSIDTLSIVLNIIPYGYSGKLYNTAIINATTPFGKISMNSSSTIPNGEISKTATVYTIPELSINIPEGFSPNRDGVNDKFVIIKPFGTELQLEVFNRWGNIVYYNSNYNNEWDGRGTNNFIGQELMDGGYYYTLKAKDIKGSTQIFKGFVLIQR